MSYRICSFNVLRSVRGDDKDRKFFDFIKKLIYKERIDIFAFQEATNINFIESVLRNISSYFSHWNGGALHNSNLAFVWNSNRVEECSRRHEPRIFSDYRSDTRMFREPAYGRFRPVDFKLNCEFRLINIHIKHGGDDSAESINTRKLECDLAKGVIYQTIDKPSTGKDGSFNRVFTVVLGDYNLDCDTCNTRGPENIRTFQDEKTTLKKDGPGYKNSYDHFSYDIKNNGTVPRNPPSRIDAVKDYFQDDFTLYRKEVSDHVPVKLEIF